EGLKRWLASPAAETINDAGLQDAIARENAMQEQFVDLVQSAVADLQSLYASSLSNVLKRSGKQQRLLQLQQEYLALKQQWQGYSTYDAWFNTGLNNAKLGTVVTYNGLVPAFTELLQQNESDLPRFYQDVIAIAGMPDS